MMSFDNIKSQGQIQDFSKMEVLASRVLETRADCSIRILQLLVNAVLGSKNQWWI